MSASAGESARLERWRRAGFNVRNLDPADVELDLASDVPHATLREAEVHGEPLREPDLDELAASLYGPARWVFTSQGRSAELALASALKSRLGGRSFRVVTHGLFRTTERALRRQGAELEIAPTNAAGRCDLELDWLVQRLGRGDLVAVYLEPSNNGLGGWPLDPEHVVRISDLCHRTECLLLLDATRLLGNGAALGAPVVEAAQRIAQAADAFTVSCGKELLVPAGGLVAVRDLDLQRKAYESCFTNGSLLQPLHARLELARGLGYVREHPQIFAHRRAQLEELAGALRDRGVPLVEPAGAHAVYVIVDALVQQEDECRPQA